MLVGNSEDRRRSAVRPSLFFQRDFCPFACEHALQIPYFIITRQQKSKEIVRGLLKTRLEHLREALTLTWTELQERLGVGESMLYFMRTGARNPSPKVLRRITELEVEAGIATPRPPHIVVKESPVEYTVTRERKQLDIVELKRQVAALKRQLATLERTLEEADHAND
jgi:transcriptional regulator with XRE-family HTH domain